MVALAGRLRAAFARYWLSEFLSNFGNGVRLAAFPLLAAALARRIARGDRCWPPGSALPC